MYTRQQSVIDLNKQMEEMRLLYEKQKYERRQQLASLEYSWTKSFSQGSSKIHPASPNSSSSDTLDTYPRPPQPPDPPDFNQFGQRLSKFEFPVFDGTLPDCWIAKVDRFFELEQCENEEKLNLISLSVEGAALKWFRRHRREFTDWTYIKRKLMARFGLVKGCSPPEVLPKEESEPHKKKSHQIETFEVHVVDKDMCDEPVCAKDGDYIPTVSAKFHEKYEDPRFELVCLKQSHDAVENHLDNFEFALTRSSLQHTPTDQCRAPFNPYQNCNDQCHYKREFGNYIQHETEFDRECEEIEDDELKDKQPEDEVFGVNVETMVMNEDEQPLECDDEKTAVTSSIMCDHQAVLETEKKIEVSDCTKTYCKANFSGLFYDCKDWFREYEEQHMSCQLVLEVKVGGHEIDVFAINERADKDDGPNRQVYIDHDVECISRFSEDIKLGKLSFSEYVTLIYLLELAIIAFISQGLREEKSWTIFIKIMKTFSPLIKDTHWDKEAWVKLNLESCKGGSLLEFLKRHEARVNMIKVPNNTKFFKYLKFLVMSYILRIVAALKGCKFVKFTMEQSEKPLITVLSYEMFHSPRPPELSCCKEDEQSFVLDLITEQVRDWSFFGLLLQWKWHPPPQATSEFHQAHNDKPVFHL